MSDRQPRANRANAQKSTGPRTKAGKQRSRLNGLRHGLTGQVSIMTDENRAAHDHWRLNRIQSIEDGLFVLGQSRPINQVDSGAPQADVALAEAMTFMRQSKESLLLTLDETRIHRNIRKNMEQPRELQSEPRAQHEKVLEEAQLLA